MAALQNIMSNLCIEKNTKNVKKTLKMPEKSYILKKL